jgi:hypothetical protein
MGRETLSKCPLIGASVFFGVRSVRLKRCRIQRCASSHHGGGFYCACALQQKPPLQRSLLRGRSERLNPAARLAALGEQAVAVAERVALWVQSVVVRILKHQHH